jgi:hypothetical protein
MTGRENGARAAGTTRLVDSDDHREQRPSDHGQARQALIFTTGVARDGAEHVPISDIGSIRLDHIHMTIAGRRGCRHLTSSQYRILLALLVRPGFCALAPTIAWHALDMASLDDPTAIRKCIQRLNKSLREVDGGLQIAWNGSEIALVGII